MTHAILVINAGSSSIKFTLFEASEGKPERLVFKGQIEGIGVEPRLVAKDSDGRTLVDTTFAAADIPDTGAAIPKLGTWLRQQLQGRLPDVVGHRIVFGGLRYVSPVRVDATVLRELQALVPLMPIHLPPELEVVGEILSQLPDVPQVAVFDTGFHHGHKPVIQRMALPESLHEDGVRRYGYHGISYEYIAGRLPEVAPEIAHDKVVVAHLGSGCSMCALIDGRSVEATMGFSALDGLPMGTRTGRLDPGVVLHLLQNKGMSAKQIEHMLYHESGLKGLSGISNDVRELLTSADPRAQFALDYFYLHCACTVADLATVMGGIDGLVFTAGVGENAAPVRAGIASKLAWLGLKIDDNANAGAQGTTRISAEVSGIACYVIPTNEELMIARHARAIVGMVA